MKKPTTITTLIKEWNVAYDDVSYRTWSNNAKSKGPFDSIPIENKFCPIIFLQNIIMLVWIKNIKINF